MIVRAAMSDGCIVTITDEWFADVVERGADWRNTMILNARVGVDGMICKVNPRFIVRLWFVQ